MPRRSARRTSTVEVVRLASGAAVNDAIISGSIDVAMAGLTVLLNLRDKTVGPNTVKGMMAIADSPIYFNTTDPRIKSVKDFQDTDRIAMTAGRGTQHAVILQMAAAVGVRLGQPREARCAGRRHLAPRWRRRPAFGRRLLQDPRHHRARSSRWSWPTRGAHPVHLLRRDRPPSHADRRLLAPSAGARSRPSSTRPRLRRCPRPWTSSARTRARQPSCSCAASPPSSGLEAIHGIIGDEKMLYFTPAPTGVMAYADHMVRTGLLKNKLANWKDAFFDNVHGLPGN